MSHLICCIVAAISGFTIAGISELERGYKKNHSFSMLATLYSAYVTLVLCVVTIIITLMTK